MRTFRVIILFLSLIPAAVLAEARQPLTVLLVSIDALHPGALATASSPVLNTLMDRGTYTLDGRSTEPPLTLVAHTAMLTGLAPEDSGKIDNHWEIGQPVVKQSTLFNTFSQAGFVTGYFYSKLKLGYLDNGIIDKVSFSRDFSVENALEFIQSSSSSLFVFLHVSGLDQVGPVSGWLSGEYMEELGYIDASIETLFKTVENRGNFLTIVTSDHAGHGTVHGSSHHPEDSLVPLILISDSISLPDLSGKEYHITDLKALVESIVFSTRAH